MPDTRSAAICHACGAPKDLALGRCATCGVLPTGDDRVLAIVCGEPFVNALDLTALSERIRRGEPLAPSAALRRQAREILYGERRADQVLTPRSMALLFAANLLLTPLLGVAYWFRHRDETAGRQALLVTLPLAGALAFAAVGWRFYA